MLLPILLYNCIAEIEVRYIYLMTLINKVTNMKKSYVFISMMIMLMACCTNDIEDSVGMPATTDNIGSTEKRSYEEAIEIAKNSISILWEAVKLLTLNIVNQ